MHPRSLILMLTVVASCSSSAARSGDTQAADESAIEAAMKGYVADVLTNDAAKIASWWVDDAIYIDRAEPTIRGRAGVDSLVRSMHGTMSVTAASVEKDDLAVSGDLAYFLGRYHEVLQPRQGAPVDVRGRFVFIWKRQSDGTWKITRSVGTDLAKVAAVAPAGGMDSSKARGG